MTTLHNGFPTNLGVAVVRGEAPATPIKVRGIDPDATLVEVKHVSGDLVTNTSVLAEASIVGEDHIQLTTTDTTGDVLIVAWKEAL